MHAGAWTPLADSISSSTPALFPVAQQRDGSGSPLTISSKNALRSW